MCSLYEANAANVDMDFDKYPADGDDYPMVGSTDMGNVSYEVPSIHPLYYIGTDAVNHTNEFAAAAGD